VKRWSWGAIRSQPFPLGNAVSDHLHKPLFTSVKRMNHSANHPTEIGKHLQPQCPLKGVLVTFWRPFWRKGRRGDEILGFLGNRAPLLVLEKETGQRVKAF
jgi:hypothetical protein